MSWYGSQGTKYLANSTPTSSISYGFWKHVKHVQAQNPINHQSNDSSYRSQISTKKNDCLFCKKPAPPPRSPAGCDRPRLAIKVAGDNRKSVIEKDATGDFKDALWLYYDIMTVIDTDHVVII